MTDDLPIGGPRTILYFAYLLVIVVLLFVLGVILAEFYDFPWLEWAMTPFVENPGVLFPIAGFIAFIVLLFIGARFVSQHVD